MKSQDYQSTGDRVMILAALEPVGTWKASASGSRVVWNPGVDTRGSRHHITCREDGT